MLFFNPIDKYLYILKEIQKAEDEKNYRDVLMISLEAVTYIPLIIIENKLPLEYFKKPLSYVINFLTVLMEEKELKELLKNFKKEADRNSISNLIHNDIENALIKIDQVKAIYDIINKNSGCGIEDIYNAVDLNNQTVRQILKWAEMLEILESSGKKYYLKEPHPNLQSVLQDKSRGKSKKGTLFSRLFKVF
jgi:hypothetical protein